MKPYYEEDGIVIYHGDCQEILPTLDKSDLLLTDPPYGNSYVSRKINFKRKGVRYAVPEYGTASIENNLERPDLNHCLDASSNQIIWGGNYFADLLPPKASWLVWDKRCDPRFYGTMTFADCELAWCSDGSPARIHRQIWNGLVRQGDPDSQAGRQHPTQKPVKLMAWCIKRFPEAKSVIDPYLGSGSTLKAAKQLGICGVGIEIEEKYCEIAADRLRQSVLTLEPEQSWR